MAISSSATMVVALTSSLVVCSLFSIASAGNFYQDFDITWGDGRAKILNGGQLLTLSLDKASGSGFQSRNEYLFGKIDMQLKLVPGNSAGTVTAYYVTIVAGPLPRRDRLRVPGNLSGDPYTLHTNVFSQGKGNREQQFKLWFDPTKDFHTYSILWNAQIIMIYSSLWNGEAWATRGGLVKTDWSKAPFFSSFRNFNADACVWSRGTSRCPSGKASWMNRVLDAATLARIKSVQKKYMIYNYCSDARQFPKGFPLECTIA
ncbi:unnamed protein product [Spirodela intermedia]|uniref:Xyloglucan endotransglucosylase/hydrolase n=1 Tax=Spirodela intermedia TaxID=51605 RepID=A0A7I8JLR1_SPIIN|nr:unnamed protein product [Spirodela intermedia]CAA6671117.1 unnamed protein product [Spirodela intermedia]